MLEGSKNIPCNVMLCENVALPLRKVSSLVGLRQLSNLGQNLSLFLGKFSAYHGQAYVMI